MRKISRILILMMIVSFSGQLAITHPATSTTCNNKTSQKKNTTHQEEEALGTMMLLPVSFNLGTSATSVN